MIARGEVVTMQMVKKAFRKLILADLQTRLLEEFRFGAYLGVTLAVSAFWAGIVYLVVSPFLYGS